MSIERIVPKQGASPRGHYSPAIRAGDFIYVSGQGPIDPATDELSPGDIKYQTALTLGNVRNILESCGATLTDVVKCSVFLRDASEFHQMNEVYAQFFGEHRPARTTIEAKFHSAEMRVEIDCVAYKPRSAA
ncbi:MAG: RidA family protein [Bryobacterales bacterium]|nr:RidA family protein [Bryobacterales bacterium]MBV9398893.1 RidA family protein [Bryobacterales bacterium]